MSMLIPSAPTLNALFTLDIHDYPAALSWSTDGQWLAVGTTAGEVLLVNVQQRLCSQRWLAHEYGLHQVSWQPGKALLATSGQDGCARLWRVGPEGLVHKVAELSVTGAPGANDWVEQLTWRPDGGQLALAAGRAVQIYRPDGVLQQQWLFPHSTVAALAWRQKGAQLAAAGYGGVLLYALDGSSGAEHLPWKGSLLNMAWSPDGKVIAAGCQDNTVHFWYTKNRQDSMMAGFEGKPKALTWNRSSRWLAVAGSADIIVWPFDGKGPEGRPPVVMALHPELLTALTFAPKGAWLLAGCRSGLLSMWPRVGAEAPVAVLQMPSAVEMTSWSSGKQLLAAAMSQCGHLVVGQAPLASDQSHQ